MTSWAPYIETLRERIAYEEGRGEYVEVLKHKLDVALRAQHAIELEKKTGQHHCLDCFEPFELGKGPCKRPQKPLPTEHT